MENFNENINIFKRCEKVREFEEKIDSNFSEILEKIQKEKENQTLWLKELKEEVNKIRNNQKHENISVGLPITPSRKNEKKIRGKSFLSMVNSIEQILTQKTRISKEYPRKNIKESYEEESKKELKKIIKLPSKTIHKKDYDKIIKKPQRVSSSVKKKTTFEKANINPKNITKVSLSTSNGTSNKDKSSGKKELLTNQKKESIYRLNYKKTEQRTLNNINRNKKLSERKIQKTDVESTKCFSQVNEMNQHVKPLSIEIQKRMFYPKEQQSSPCPLTIQKHQDEDPEAVIQKALETQAKINASINALTSNDSVNNEFSNIPSPLSTPRASQTYDISDLNSDDSSDDDDFSNKKIPDWAEEEPLRKAIYEQFTNNIDPYEIFAPSKMPDLDEIFEKKKARFKIRTSSACWAYESPLLVRKNNK